MVLYKDASGETIQLLPNPHRNDNYFNGGTIYEIPSGKDKFDLEVNPPFGEENIIIYAGSLPLGEIEVQTRGPVYGVKMQMKDVDIRTRGVKFVERSEGKAAASARRAEFFEDKVAVKTGR
jgi:hypothetical protein